MKYINKQYNTIQSMTVNEVYQQTIQSMNVNQQMTRNQKKMISQTNLYKKREESVCLIQIIERDSHMHVSRIYFGNG